MKERIVHAKKLVGKKRTKEKTYDYVYFTLPLNLYLPKSMVEKYGTEYLLTFDEDAGTITIRPVVEK